MERYCATGQSPQRAVALLEEEVEDVPTIRRKYRIYATPGISHSI